jgi:4-deoxy-L-threo-5-hexosulose-uronate ketol-isomerase
MMEIRYSTSAESVKSEIRRAFLLDKLFLPDVIQMVYTDIDRAIIGSAAPIISNLKLLSSRKEMASEYFLERREIGIINVGGSGIIKADGQGYNLEKNDMIYLGKGTKGIEFMNEKSDSPPLFYFVSYPAHKEYPAQLIKKETAEKTNLGSLKNANKRTINKYIHPNGVKSCQLVMGMTQLEEGSVWNTMPVHTHQRRSEIYMYYDIGEEALLMHFMGQPEETRHIIIRNLQAVISPVWSIHSGCCTQNYSFVWAMGGENQDFSDMDSVGMQELL